MKRFTKSTQQLSTQQLSTAAVLLLYVGRDRDHTSHREIGRSATDFGKLEDRKRSIIGKLLPISDRRPIFQTIFSNSSNTAYRGQTSSATRQFYRLLTLAAAVCVLRCALCHPYLLVDHALHACAHRQGRASESFPSLRYTAVVLLYLNARMRGFENLRHPNQSLGRSEQNRALSFRDKCSESVV